MSTTSNLAEQRRTISHDELMALPIVQYTGPIHVISGDEQLHAAAAEIARERVIGFDTETRPTFRKGQIHNPSLVQIATSRAAYLFQLCRLPCERTLAEIFANPHLIKAGLALGRDLTDLRRLFPFEAANMLDLGDVAKRHGLEQTGLRNLAGLFLNARITKSSRTSNWAQPTLTAAQCRYAATDAWICRELFLRFEARGWLTPLPPPTSTAAPRT